MATDVKKALWLPWLVTAILLAITLACTVIWTRNIGIEEDWLMVPPWVGRQPDLLGWLWSQNNEHRLPLARLVYLLLLKSTDDFRSGMVVSQSLMAALSLLLTWASTKARGGVARWSDILFPLSLLHLGHWENLLWGWQIQFVSSTFLCGLLLASVIYAKAPGIRGSIAAAVTLFLLPFSGANGVAMSVGMLPWAVAAALLPRAPGADPRVPIVLLLGVVLSAAASVTYFIGYVSPPWSPPLADPRQFYVAAKAYLAMATGPRSPTIDTPVALSVLLISLLGAGFAVSAFVSRWRSGDARSFGLAVFIGNNLLLGAIIVLSRGAYPYPMPARYALFSVMPLLAALIALELYGPPIFAKRVISSFALCFLILLPFNARAGFRWRQWYVDGMLKVEADIGERRPLSLIAEQNGNFLMHSCGPCLLQAITDLRDAKIKPFAGLPD